MDDDESLALALALSVAESGNQNSNPPSPWAETSNDETLARQLQQDLARDSGNGPATYQRQEHQPPRSAPPETPAIPGKAPSGLAAVLSGLKGFAKRAPGKIDPNGGTKRPGNSPKLAGELWIEVPSALLLLVHK